MKNSKNNKNHLTPLLLGAKMMCIINLFIALGAYLFATNEWHTEIVYFSSITLLILFHFLQLKYEKDSSSRNIIKENRTLENSVRKNSKLIEDAHNESYDKLVDDILSKEAKEELFKHRMYRIRLAKVSNLSRICFYDLTPDEKKQFHDLGYLVQQFPHDSNATIISWSIYEVHECFNKPRKDLTVDEEYAYNKAIHSTNTRAILERIRYQKYLIAHAKLEKHHSGTDILPENSVFSKTLTESQVSMFEMAKYKVEFKETLNKYEISWV